MSVAPDLEFITLLKQRDTARADADRLTQDTNWSIGNLKAEVVSLTKERDDWKRSCEDWQRRAGIVPMLQEQLAGMTAELDDMRRAWAILDEPSTLQRMPHTAESAAMMIRQRLEASERGCASLRLELENERKLVEQKCIREAELAVQARVADADAERLAVALGLQMETHDVGHSPCACVESRAALAHASPAAAPNDANVAPSNGTVECPECSRCGQIEIEAGEPILFCAQCSLGEGRNVRLVFTPDPAPTCATCGHRGAVELSNVLNQGVRVPCPDCRGSGKGRGT
jgi:hypothetical protein